MPLRLTAKEAHRLLTSSGFFWARTKGSHRIYEKNSVRIVVAFHSGRELHPKSVKEIYGAIGDARKN